MLYKKQELPLFTFRPTFSFKFSIPIKYNIKNCIINILRYENDIFVCMPYCNVLKSSTATIHKDVKNHLSLS